MERMNTQGSLVESEGKKKEVKESKEFQLSHIYTHTKEGLDCHMHLNYILTQSGEFGLLSHHNGLIVLLITNEI